MVAFAHLMEVPLDQERGCLVEPLPRHLIEKMERICEKRKASHWKKGKDSIFRDLHFIHMHSEDRSMLQARPLKCSVWEVAVASGLGMDSCCFEGKQDYDLSSGLPWGCLISSDDEAGSGTLRLSRSQANILAPIWRVQSAHSSTKHFLQISSLPSPQSFDTSYSRATLLCRVIVNSFSISSILGQAPYFQGCIPTNSSARETPYALLETPITFFYNNNCKL